MFAAFRKIFVKDYELQRVQDNVAQYFQEMRSKAIIDGVMLDATVTNANTVIAHTLGRQPQGWIIVNRKAVTAGAEGNIVFVGWDDRNITLKNTAIGTTPLTLWVF